MKLLHFGEGVFLCLKKENQGINEDIYRNFLGGFTYMSGLSDKVKSGVNKVKGEIKDQVGNATNNAKLQAEGKIDKAKAAAQDKVGDLKDKHDK